MITEIADCVIIAQLRPARHGHHVGRAERRRVRERHVEVVDEPRLPVGRGELGARSSAGTGSRGTAGSRRRARPGRRGRTPSTRAPNTITFVIQIAAPVSSNVDGSRIPSARDQVDDQATRGTGVREAHDGDERQADDPDRTRDRRSTRADFATNTPIRIRSASAGSTQRGRLAMRSGSAAMAATATSTAIGDLHARFLAGDARPRRSQVPLGELNGASRIDQPFEAAEDAAELVPGSRGGGCGAGVAHRPCPLARSSGVTVVGLLIVIAARHALILVPSTG